MIPLRDNAPTDGDPWVNWLLIFTCVLVYIIQVCYPGGYQHSLDVWGEIPTRILAGENVPGSNIPAWVTMFTAMFMHGGFFHLLGNMLALWLFGDNIEWLLGRWKYVLFYLLCGLASSAATVWLGYESYEPGMGASGAIAGVMTAYVLIYPRARITSLLWFSPFGIAHIVTGQWGFVQRNISAIWYVGSWVVLQLLLALIMIGGEVHMNLGIYAHAAGALAGAVLVWPLLIRDRLPSADHDAVSAEISAPIWGEEGDGGDGTPELTEEDRIARRLPAKVRRFQRSFQDFRAEELIASEQYALALQHCEDMLGIADQRGEEWRVEGYENLIEQIRERMPRTAAERPKLPPSRW